MSEHVKINNRTAVMTRERYDALGTDSNRTLDVVNTAKKEGHEVHGATELQADGDTVSFALAFYREADPADEVVEELTEDEEAALLAILGEPDAERLEDLNKSLADSGPTVPFDLPPPFVPADDIIWRR